MTSDHEDWETGEHPRPMPVAPSRRGASQPKPATPVKTDGDTADDQDQQDNGE